MIKYCPFMSYRNEKNSGVYCFKSGCPLYQDECLIAKVLLKYIGEEKPKDLEEKLNEMKKDIYIAGLGFPIMRSKDD